MKKYLLSIFATAVVALTLTSPAFAALTHQPTDQTVKKGEPATFIAGEYEAEGAASIDYQWFALSSLIDPIDGIWSANNDLDSGPIHINSGLTTTEIGLVEFDAIIVNRYSTDEILCSGKVRALVITEKRPDINMYCTDDGSITALPSNVERANGGETHISIATREADSFMAASDLTYRPAESIDGASDLSLVISPDSEHYRDGAQFIFQAVALFDYGGYIERFENLSNIVTLNIADDSDNNGNTQPEVPDTGFFAGISDKIKASPIIATIFIAGIVIGISLLGARITRKKR